MLKAYEEDIMRIAVLPEQWNRRAVGDDQHIRMPRLDFGYVGGNQRFLKPRGYRLQSAPVERHSRVARNPAPATPGAPAGCLYSGVA